MELVNENPDIAKFNSKRQELIQTADAFLAPLKKYIEKYVQTEKL